MKKIILALFLSLFIQVAVADFSTALESYQQGELTKAADEFKTLANHNDADAQYMLGYMYALGEGVTQDYIEAHKWLNIAASQGKDGASEARDRVAGRMSGSQTTQAQQLAGNWKPVPTQIPLRFAGSRTQPQTTVSINSRNTIREVQRRLSELGYRPGPADGAPGRRTHDAIRQYQRDNRLVVNGQITQKLVAHLLPGGTTGSPAWSFPQVWSAPATKPSGATRALIRELESLIEKIRANKAADRWVVKKLRQLVRKNQRSWPQRLMHERFSRKNYRLERNWEITSGRFRVQPGSGLQSNAIASSSSRGSKRKNLAKALLRSFIEGNDRPLRKRQVAQIVSTRKISNAFATRARFGSIENGSRISFMLSQGRKRDSGYRLVLDTRGKRDELKLIRFNRHGNSLIDSYRGRLNLANGSSHTLEWTRDKRGRMVVAINGKELLRVSDTDLKKGFNQLSITNTGGDYLLRDLMLLDAG